MWLSHCDKTSYFMQVLSRARISFSPPLGLSSFDFVQHLCRTQPCPDKTLDNARLKNRCPLVNGRHVCMPISTSFFHQSARWALRRSHHWDYVAAQHFFPHSLPLSCNGKVGIGADLKSYEIWVLMWLCDRPLFWVRWPWQYLIVFCST